MKPLPASAALARPLADPRAILRPTPHDDDGSVLPERAEQLVGARGDVARNVRRVLMMLLVSVGGVWLVTVNAWDHDGFFPWFWNLVWLLFPWFFLAPLWAAVLRGMRREGADTELHRGWAEQRAAAVHDVATVTESVHDRTDSGGMSGVALRVEGGGVTSTVARLAETPGLLPSELPQPGETVHRFTLPTGRVVLQASRRRGAAPTLADELERLTALRDAGALDAAQFEAAKARLLG